MQSTVNYQQLVEAVGDAVMAADASGAINLWNPACERMFGYTEAEALGKSLDIIIPQRQQQRHWDGYAHTMASGKTKYGTTVLRVPAVHKDGHTLSIAFSVALLFTPEGKVASIVAVVRDESAKFAEERALRKRLTELETQAAGVKTA
ncbi:PAS domain-containing protein [uncultured Ramlibacter sp.]|uniref:PAS domain-containing protein n=1 Tax=uncultured Ramlibacter sp. TaxID=260755 RepID=UPI002632A0D8|nr:PAS domain-containing protein [uncultured Ramlibacter sp.]